ncbi:hypothetical protein J2Z69_003101 [Paenibacillus shirakamiensis]|uniref:Uncharacterized protein n=1 Tax=Paenibacillus shirakamiensis TaxID=1265935 RepID=A0ABS4JK06_9BACL|nr:hypothetical protein [Paenibacillus shirakamiensis]MBP2002044.1 hypothetical protein [Paenibacillus shirakamiensis]
MIPFERTLPYDIMMGDVYVPSCPFCNAENVLIPMKIHEIQSVKEGKKKLLVFPCCHSRLTLLDSDGDYLLTDQTIPRH